MKLALKLCTIFENAPLWYRAGGISPSDIIAIYQPSGAQSYAASLLNIANPATHALSDAGGIAPAWTSALGWQGATGKYLISDIVPDATMSVIVKYSSWSVGVLAGVTNGTPGYFLSPNSFKKGTSGPGVAQGVIALATGVIAIAGVTAYQNGISCGNCAGSDYGGLPFYLVGRNASGTMVNDVTGYIQAVAFYSIDITPYLSALQNALSGRLSPIDAAPIMAAQFTYSSSIGV